MTTDRFRSFDGVGLQRQHLSIRSARVNGDDGRWWNNAAAESFLATSKHELIEVRSRPTRFGSQRVLFEYIEGWFCTSRLNPGHGYLSPAEARQVK